MRKDKDRPEQIGPSDELVASIAEQLRKPGALCHVAVRAGNRLHVDLSFNPAIAQSGEEHLCVTLRRAVVEFAGDVPAFEWGRDFLTARSAADYQIAEGHVREEAAKQGLSRETSFLGRLSLDALLPGLKGGASAEAARRTRRDIERSGKRGEELRTSRTTNPIRIFSRADGLYLDLVAAPGADLVELNAVFAAASLLDLGKDTNPAQAPDMIVRLRVPDEGPGGHQLKITEARGAWAQFSDANRRILAELLLSRLHAPIQLWPQQATPPAERVAVVAQDLRRLAAAPPQTGFVDLVGRTSLDPAKDFRAADLTGTDLRRQDLSGFDLTDALTEGALIDEAARRDSAAPEADHQLSWVSLSPITPSAVERMSDQLGRSYRRDRRLESQLMYGAVATDRAEHLATREAIRQTVGQADFVAFVRFESAIELQMASILAEELKTNPQAGGMLFVEAPPSRTMPERMKLDLEAFALRHMDVAWISFDGAPYHATPVVRGSTPSRHSRTFLDDYVPTLLGRVAAAGPTEEVRSFYHPELRPDQLKILPLSIFGAPSPVEDPVQALIRASPHLTFDEGRGRSFVVIANEDDWRDHAERLAHRLPYANVYGRSLPAGEPDVFFVGAATGSPIWDVLLGAAHAPHASLRAPDRRFRMGDPVGKRS